MKSSDASQAVESLRADGWLLVSRQVPACDRRPQLAECIRPLNNGVAEPGHQALIECEVVKRKQAGNEHLVREKEVSKIRPGK
jgi:hypothetical protein